MVEAATGLEFRVIARDGTETTRTPTQILSFPPSQRERRQPTYHGISVDVEEKKIASPLPPLENTVGKYTARIDNLYKWLPLGGYSENPIIKEIAGQGTLVANHFDLGLFGDISLVVRKEDGTTETYKLEKVRLAHLHYPAKKPHLYADYSMGEEGDTHKLLVARLPAGIVQGTDRYKPEEYHVLVGTTTTLTRLFAPLKKQVFDLAEIALH